MKQPVTTQLAPLQVGFSVRLGAEAVVHATSSYLQILQPCHIIIKLDFKNALKSIHRD